MAYSFYTNNSAKVLSAQCHFLPFVKFCQQQNLAAGFADNMPTIIGSSEESMGKIFCITLSLSP